MYSAKQSTLCRALWSCSVSVTGSVTDSGGSEPSLVLSGWTYHSGLFREDIYNGSRICYFLCGVDFPPVSLMTKKFILANEVNL